MTSLDRANVVLSRVIHDWPEELIRVPERFDAQRELANLIERCPEMTDLELVRLLRRMMTYLAIPF